MMGSVTSTTDDGMLEIGGEDGNVGQGRGTSDFHEHFFVFPALEIWYHGSVIPLIAQFYGKKKPTSLTS